MELSLNWVSAHFYLPDHIMPILYESVDHISQFLRIILNLPSDFITDVMSFEFELKNSWVQEYDHMTNPISLSLKTAFESKVSRLFFLQIPEIKRGHWVCMQLLMPCLIVKF